MTSAKGDINRLVVTRVMGINVNIFCVCDVCEPDWDYPHNCHKCRKPPFPEYTENIAAAWEVVEKMRVDNTLYSIAPCGDPDEPWCVKAWVDGNREFFYAATLQMAVCLAALAVARVPEEDVQKARGA